MAKLLIKLAAEIDTFRKASYIEYYVREHRNTLNMEEVKNCISKISKDGKIIKDGVEIEQVPRLFTWFEDILSL